MKLLFVSHETSRTGAPMVLLHLLRWLKVNQREMQVDLLVLNGGALEIEFKKSCHDFYNYAQLVKPAKLKLWQRVLLKLGWFKKPNLKEILLNQLVKNNYKVVYGNTVACIPLVNDLAAKNKTTKYIAHIHELNTMIKLISPQFKDYKTAIDQFIVPSQLVKTNLVENWAILESKIEVVYECALTTVKKAKPLVSKKEYSFTIGASGTVDWRKGHDIFIQVARYLHANYPSFDFKLVWVGAMQLYQQIIIEEDLKKLGLQEKVSFVGEQANPSSYYEDFDVFVMTSREDPFPLVCIEVGMLGKPIISFDKAVGTNEILEKAGGYIVPYLNIEAMSKKIVQYYKNPRLKASHGALNKTAFSQFTPELICPKLLAVIQYSQNK